MFFVTYRDNETGKEYTKNFTHERDAMRSVTAVELYVNLDLIATNVDVAKFRH